MASWRFLEGQKMACLAESPESCLEVFARSLIVYDVRLARALGDWIVLLEQS